jgi:ABC-type phosphate transport system substrate-binding protein
MNLNSKLLGGAAIALLAATFAAPAQAQTTVLYSGGATFPEKLYRDIFNCYGDTSGGETTAFLAGGATGCNGATPYRSDVAPLYVGVGSGNALKAWQTHDASQFTRPTGGSARTPDRPPVPSTTAYGTFYGTGVGASWTPSSAGPDFPKVSFIGSDDPLTATNISTYNTNSNGWGAPIQVPGFVGTVAAAFNQASGTWTEKGKDLHTSGASSKVQFSPNTLCGLFTGAISDWSDNEIKVDNANTQLGSGAIHIVYRSDGSGTTFIFTNALIHQCGSQTNPRAGITHPIPDQWLADNGIANTAGLGADNIGNSNNNFFININTAGHIPANFVGASGNGGIKTTINANAGYAGYLSVDFTKNGNWNSTLGQVVPFDSTGPKAANLQTWYSFVNSGLVAPKFVVAGPKAGTANMGAIKAPLFTAASCDAAHATGKAPGLLSSDGICAHNPLNWGVVNPLPLATAAYPIGGFTFLDMYTCYASATDVNALVAKVATTPGTFGLFRWYFGSTTDNAGLVKRELTANGFSLPPSSWISGAKKLLTTDIKTAIGTPGQLKTGCSAVTGSGA